MTRIANRPPKAELENRYITQGMTGAAVAADYGVSVDVFKDWCRHYGISKRPDLQHKLVLELTPEETQAHWATHRSVRAMGEALGISGTQVRRLLRDVGIDYDKRPGERKGERQGSERKAARGALITKTTALSSTSSPGDTRCPTQPRPRPADFHPVETHRGKLPLQGPARRLPPDQQAKVGRLLALFRYHEIERARARAWAQGEKEYCYDKP